MSEIHYGIMVASARLGGNMVRKRPIPLASARAATETLRSAADSPGDAALVAHDVRNLLHSAAGRAELLEKRLGEEERAQLRSVRRDVALAAMLCEELLAAAASGRPAPFADVDLGTVATAATATFRGRSGEQLPIQFAGPEARVIVRGRFSELERALLNLMWNALDAMEQGFTPAPRLDLHWGRNARGAFIEVRDHGPGLPAVALADLARPFRSTHGGEGKVRGLGLAGVQRILRAHEGVLEAAAPAHGPGSVLRMQFGMQRELEFGA
jgi:C4-dicarboxylate-specific signal transduction histidine kinase